MPEISATIRVVDAFSNPLDKLANGLSRAQSGFSRLKGALGGNMFGGAEKSRKDRVLFQFKPAFVYA